MKDDTLSKGTDIVYQTCYRACAGGPFQKPPEDLFGEVKIMRRLGAAPHCGIELWDNDGIVNTLSMLWPRGENVLVAADHMDIVGHYKNRAADPGGGRKNRAYDLLNSGLGFGDKMFGAIWEEIFAFAVGHISKVAKATVAA